MMTYEVGSMAHTVDCVTFPDIGLAFFPDFFDDARKIAPKDAANTARACSMMKIGWVDSESDCLDFDVTRSHSLLFDVRKSSNAMLYDNDGLHDAQILQRAKQMQ